MIQQDCFSFEQNNYKVIHILIHNVIKYKRIFIVVIHKTEVQFFSSGWRKSFIKADRKWLENQIHESSCANGEFYQPIESLRSARTVHKGEPK